MTIPQSSLWDTFTSKHENVEFVWLQFMSYTSLLYTRIIPVAKFASMLETGKFIAIPKLVFSLGPRDIFVEGAWSTENCWLRPDMETAYCQPGSKGTRAIIMCDCVDKDGSPSEECGRSRLMTLENMLRTLHGFSALVGFEIEVVFMRPTKDQNGARRFLLTNLEHSWSSMTKEDQTMLDLIEEISRTLATVGIALEQVHSEAAPGQWEFILPPARPVQAVDMLVKAREVIKRVASLYNLHATLYPRVSSSHPGTGAHVHISVNPATSDARPQKAETFFAGILNHMPSILAFTLPQEISYSRVASGLWSGGEWACWGWENKEAPLRRIEDNRFEFKLMDGLANPYLALSALFAAGIDGIFTESPLQGEDCSKPAYILSPEERHAIGVKTLLPKSIEESLDQLDSNTALRKLCGSAIISPYIAVKWTEARVLREMDIEERKNWLIARY